MQNWTFKTVALIMLVMTLACKSSSNNQTPQKSLVETDTTKAVEIKESPVKKVELTGQDLLDSFADEYYLHYPDNVTPRESIKVPDEVNPRMFYKADDFQKALALYLVQVKEYPDNPYVNFYTAMSAYNAGAYETALTHFNRQQTKFPDDKYTRVTYFYEGLTYLRLGEVEKCEEIMQDYLDRGGIMKGRIAMLSQDIRLKWNKADQSQP